MMFGSVNGSHTTNAVWFPK